MRKTTFKTGDIIIFKTPKEIEKDYGEFNKDDFVWVNSQTYSKEMYENYKNYIFSILRIEDDRVIFYDSSNAWEKITIGMIKRITKIPANRR